MDVPSINTLVPLVVEAGEIAREHFQRVGAERKTDRTLVTAADRAVERFLVERLTTAMPQARILGEELGAAGAAGSRCTLTVDPIDGTAAFVAGLPTWCVTVGLVCDGHALGGVTCLPMTSETYVAADGEARWNGHVIPAGRRPPCDGDPFIVVHSDLHRGRRIRFPGKVRALGSTAYHLALVARGAAVAALLAAVGGELRYLSGAPLDLTELLGGERASGHLVALAPGMLEEILPQLQAPS